MKWLKEMLAKAGTVCQTASGNNVSPRLPFNGAKTLGLNVDIP